MWAGGANLRPMFVAITPVAGLGADMVFRNKGR